MIDVLAHAKDGRVTPDGAEYLCRQLNFNNNELLLRFMEAAKVRAHPPTSNYQVGAAALGISGAIYIGANIEIDRSDISQTIHAEQCVISNAYYHGETGLRVLASTAPPCGFCRQFLYELDGAADLKIILPEDVHTSLRELLPAPFGPKNLGVEAGLLKPQDHDLKGRSISGSLLSEIALNCARKSYAPYTKAYSGAAISVVDGKSFGGIYVENAAFNPTISAIKSALCQVLLSGYGLGDIRAVHIAQVESSSIGHIQCAKTIVDSLPGSISFSHEFLLIG